MNIPAPVRVRLAPESNEPEKIFVVEYKREWAATDELWRGGDKSNEQKPTKTYGTVQREHFFTQPAPLGFDPLELDAQKEKLEKGEASVRQVWAEPAAAIIWMAVGFRHLRSQYYNGSCLELGKALSTGGTKKYPITNPTELRGLAVCQPDPAVQGIRLEYWEALWPYLSGNRYFFYRIVRDDPNYVDERAEYKWLSPSMTRWPI